MPYDPPIILDIDELRTKSDKIDEMFYSYNDIEVHQWEESRKPSDYAKLLRYQAVEKLQELMHKSTSQVVFKGVAFTEFEWDGSQSNKAMRELLTELKVDYAVKY